MVEFHISALCTFPTNSMEQCRKMAVFLDLNMHCRGFEALLQISCGLIKFRFEFAIFLLSARMDVVLSTTLVEISLLIVLEWAVLCKYGPFKYIQQMPSHSMTRHLLDGSEEKMRKAIYDPFAKKSSAMTVYTWNS